jgi:2-C-methyl-D-erythritol 2,4-cyclodiphosphate synthase
MLVTRVGTGFDAHRFGADRSLILGGVEIPHSSGLVGHSDADVLCHAITDSLLGAAAYGDIGRHFPDSDAQWKNADSLEILRQVVGMLEEKGYRVGNVDSTVVAEEPKIAPYVDKMRASLAGALGVSLDCVSVKGTTVESMGAIGRREGIAVMASSTIERV